MKKLCIYHGDCADGFGAAWVVKKALGDGVEFHKGVYGETPPDVKGREVIIVDFSYKRDVVEKMAQEASSITIIDHHKSAFEDLMVPHERLGFVSSVDGVHMEFDMSRSGAMMAWDYFFPNQEPPALIRYIQDRDLWRFELLGTKEIQSAVFSYQYDFDVWDDLMKIDVSELCKQGEAIYRKHLKDINEFIECSAHRIVIDGHDVPALNAPYMWASDACHIMAKGEKFAVSYYNSGHEDVYSLRSDESGLDVSEIAKKFGGGGHKHAAGFRLNRN